VHVAVTAGSPRLARETRLTAFCELARHATVVFANADEARALTGEDLEGAVRALASVFPLACVTNGRDGAILAAEDEVYHARPTLRREAEVVGAGDAFAGLLLVALARGDRYEDALRLSVDTAV
jgi:sugar/nucleoside kinase (ribokinase family)